MPFNPRVYLPEDDEFHPDHDHQYADGDPELSPEELELLESEEWLGGEFADLCSTLTAESSLLNSLYPPGATSPAKTAASQPSDKEAAASSWQTVRRGAIGAACVLIAIGVYWTVSERESTDSARLETPPSEIATRELLPPAVGNNHSLGQTRRVTPASSRPETQSAPVFLRDASEPELEAMYDLWEHDGETSIEI